MIGDICAVSDGAVRRDRLSCEKERQPLGLDRCPCVFGAASFAPFHAKTCRLYKKWTIYPSTDDCPIVEAASAQRGHHINEENTIIISTKHRESTFAAARMEENESLPANGLGSEAISDAAALPMDVDSDDIDEDADSSDGNWSSGSSFNEDSDDESILTYDAADDESINFVRPNRRSGWTTSCYSDDKGPFSHPDGEGSWRMDPEDSYSDYTLVVVSKETEVERTYHVHKFTLAHGQCGCDYFAALFRTTCRENVEGSSRFTFPTETANAFPDFLILSIILATWATSLCSTGNSRRISTEVIYFLCERWLCTLVAAVC